MLKELCTQGKKVCNILWCEKSYQTRVSQRYCISWGLMYSLFWTESLAIQKFFPATDFCFTWESLFQLKCNLHFSPNLLALLSSSGKFDRDVFNYTNKLSSRQCLTVSLTLDTWMANFVHEIVKSLVQQQVFIQSMASIHLNIHSIHA